jgi:hypothetical protein
MRMFTGATFLIATVAIAGVTAPANASVIYDLTLTATSDQTSAPLTTFDGTGTLTLASTPSSSGLVSEGSDPVTFSIDGQSFSGTGLNVSFLNGSLYGLQFSQQVGSNPNRFDLQVNGAQFQFSYANEQDNAYGTVVAAPAPSTPVPEPLTLSLFGAGVAGAGVLRRRKKNRTLAV